MSDLNDQRIEVHFLPLGPDAAEGLESRRSWLGAEELARAERFVFERDRVRFLWWHGETRRILAGCVGGSPADVEYYYGRNGKPGLAGHPEWEFNLAHSGDWAVLAIGRGGAVGIDVENEDSAVAVDDLAAACLTSRECDVLQASGGLKQRVFYRYWTAKEALMKALGLGMSLDPREIEVVMDGTLAPVAYSRICGDASAGRQWRLFFAQHPCAGPVCVAAPMKSPGIACVGAPGVEFSSAAPA